MSSAETTGKPAVTRDDAVIGAGLLAGGANIIMQLARPAVGYGVVESKVEDGNVFRHPVKRTRTTLTYLAVAMLGTDEERAAYRRAVTKQHVQVRSTESSPVSYNAMDPGLQLWVAACLYKGFEDTYRIFAGPVSAEMTEQFYGSASPLGTTLQVRESMWPADRDAFERYWNTALDEVAIDDTVREYLYRIATLGFLPKPVSTLLGPFNRFVTTGFLPPRFREEMRLEWTPRQQRRFDRLMGAISAVVTRVPKPVREFPYNACLWDLRRRLRRGQPLV
ncbi:oxygenase MpaB family protein [Saccharomonospora sp. NPDC006951]